MSVKLSFISVMRSCIFSIITPVFSVTWSSEIIIICWFAAQETFLIIINVENSCAAQYFCGNWCILFFRIHRWIERTALIRNITLQSLLINLTHSWWSTVLICWFVFNYPKLLNGSVSQFPKKCFSKDHVTLKTGVMMLKIIFNI